MTRPSNKLAFGKNNNSRLTFGQHNSDDEIDRFGVNSNSIEHIKKSKKLKLKII